MGREGSEDYSRSSLRRDHKKIPVALGVSPGGKISGYDLILPNVQTRTLRFRPDVCRYLRKLVYPVELVRLGKGICNCSLNNASVAGHVASDRMPLPY